MDFQFLLDNLLSPPILFFALGLLAVWARSDLDLPAPLPKVLGLYLLFAIGFKGGVALRQTPTGEAGYVVSILVAGMVMAAVVPFLAYAVLRRRLGVHDAAAMAATYGSISAVTFITATAFLDTQSIVYGGHMVAAMALMESPAIVAGVLLVRLAGEAAGDAPPQMQPAEAPEDLTGHVSPPDQHSHNSWGRLLHEAFLNGPVFLLLGSLVVGLVAAQGKAAAIKPFVEELFNVVLLAFLLDMGIVAARRMGDLRRAGAFLVGFGLVAPLVMAAVALVVARLLGMTPGDALLFLVLCASASYIAVPAACRLAIPQANPSLYVPMALAVTFPFNITVGIPLYWWAVNWMIGA